MLAGKKLEIVLSLTYDRNNLENEVHVTVAEFKQEENQGKVGIGIGLVDDKEINCSSESNG